MRRVLVAVVALVVVGVGVVAVRAWTAPSLGSLLTGDPRSTPAAEAPRAGDTATPAVTTFDPPPLPHGYPSPKRWRYAYVLQAGGYATEADACRPTEPRGPLPLTLAPGGSFYVRVTSDGQGRPRFPVLAAAGGAVRRVAARAGVAQYRAEHVGRVDLMVRRSRCPVYRLTIADTTRPARPERITMRTVRRHGLAQEFRPYSGPASTGVTESDALARVSDPRPYSLGRWDVGLVSDSGGVEWHHVWVVGSERFFPDLGILADGPVSPFLTYHPPTPGWSRNVSMFDVSTGRFFMGYSF